jgi:hypothetical protein
MANIAACVWFAILTEDDMNLPTVDQSLSAGRHFVTYGMGMATAFGITAIQGVDLSVVNDSLNHIFNGIKEISVGLGPLVGIAMAWLAARKQSPAVKIADVTAMAGNPQIIVPPTAPVDSPLRIAAADPAQPKVTMATAPVAPSVGKVA